MQQYVTMLLVQLRIAPQNPKTPGLRIGFENLSFQLKYDKSKI